VQKLQAARQSLQLPSMLAKLDHFDLIILDLCAVSRYVEFGRARHSDSRSR